MDRMEGASMPRRPMQAQRWPRSFEGADVFPRPLRAGRAQAGNGQGQWPRSRSSWRWPTRCRKSCRRTPWRARRGRHYGDRALRLSQPGEQRPLLSLHIFRGALDCGATAINEEMKLACLKAIADLAHEGARATWWPRPWAVRGKQLRAGLPDPQPLRSRAWCSRSGAGRRQGGDGQRRRGAADRGLRRPTARFPSALRLPLRPHHEAGVPARARSDPKRVIYAEGEDERVLRAVQVVVDEGTAPGRSSSAGPTW